MTDPAVAPATDPALAADPLADPPATLPIISITPFLHPSSPLAKRQSAAALNAACTTHGFFYLTGHPIPVPTLHRLLALSREFFALPQPVKDSIARRNPGQGGDGARGYQKLLDNITKGKHDWHEAIDFYRDVDSADYGGTELFDPSDAAKGYTLLRGPNLWPSAPEEFAGLLRWYWNEMEGLGRAMMRAMAWALGYEEDEEVLLRQTDRAFWVGRVIGYPPLPAGHDTGDGLSCGEHTDYGCTTFLYTTPHPGSLQVQTKDGKWIDADPIEGAYVVNIGDMMEIWTNGLWKSTKHRVIHRSEGFRISIPYFYEPNLEAVVQPLDKCVETTGGVRKYEEACYGEHLRKKVGSNFKY